MRIAVNTRFLRKDYLEGYGNFLYEIFSRITRKNPEHEFIFIFDRPYDESFVFSSNVKPVITGPAARHPFLWKWWYDVKVPGVLKKNKADIFVSCDGFCSLTAKAPQCLVVHDLAFLYYPHGNKRLHLFFYKKYTPRFLKKAARIITVSQFSKKTIIENYNTPPEKIAVVPNGVKENFLPAADEVRESIKQKYTDGKAYYLCVGAIHPRKNLYNVLKAFSVFKKRQQTEMKLVIAGRLGWKYDSFVKSLQSYKYRDDVVLTGFVNDTELTAITGAAYGLVYVSLFEGFGVPVLEAMKCKVPVITSANSAMQEIAGGAALYANPEDYNDIAEKIMLLYKDEQLRNELTRKGAIVAGEYTWGRAAELFWEQIAATVSDK